MWLRKKKKQKDRKEERDGKKKSLPQKGLENDTIVEGGDESEACSAQYQHNAVGRKPPIWLPAALVEIDDSSKHFNMH